MARSVKAVVQDALAEEVLHHRVRAPQRVLDAVERDSKMAPLPSLSHSAVIHSMSNGESTAAEFRNAKAPERSVVRVQAYP